MAIKNKAINRSITAPYKIKSGSVRVGSNGAESADMRWRYDTLTDGGFISIELKNSTFTQPKYLGTLGFGMGWLHNKAIDTPLYTHTCKSVTGNHSIVSESPIETSKRFIKVVNGRRYLYTLLAPVAQPTSVGAGMIEFPAGSTILSGETAFMFSSVRITNTRPEDALKTYQFKQDRISQGFGLVYSRNTTYVKRKAGTLGAAASVHAGGTAQNPDLGGGDYDVQNGTGPLPDGHLTDFAWTWRMNTPDSADGFQHWLTVKNGSGLKVTPFYNTGQSYPDNIIGTGSTDRPDTMKWQDYVGNNDTNGNARDIEVLRTDMFCQVEGTRIWIGDGATIGTCTHMVPLVPVLFESSTKWHFKLWKGSLNSYNNAHLFKIDDYFNVLAVAKIVP